MFLPEPAEHAEAAPAPAPGRGAPATLAPEHRRPLLRVASDAIAYGLRNRSPMPVQAADYPPPLQALQASFVTLKTGGQLRGCIGTLEAARPLVVDVAHNAHAAAFHDPRFPPLRVDEFVQLDVHISLLSAPEPLSFDGEEDLVRKLRPGIDGLILTEGYHRGTFLPAVWESIPDAAQFLAHLKLKAGLPIDYWSPSVRVQRYTAESIP